MNEIKQCFKCGIKEGELHKTKNRGLTSAVLIKHHTNYDLDTIVDCCSTCHKKIHDKVRKNNLCKYSPTEAHIISKRSTNSRHEKKYIRSIWYTETMQPNITLYEHLKYNTHSGNISVSSWFSARSGMKLYEEVI